MLVNHKAAHTDQRNNRESDGRDIPEYPPVHKSSR